jgi:hypothetical protein
VSGSLLQYKVASILFTISHEVIMACTRLNPFTINYEVVMALRALVTTLITFTILATKIINVNKSNMFQDNGMPYFEREIQLYFDAVFKFRLTLFLYLSGS